MSQIHPFTGTVIPGSVPPVQAAERERQLRRVQNLQKNTALQGDRLEHEVESADAVAAPNEEPDHRQQPRQRPFQTGDDASGDQSSAAGDEHIDVTA